MAAEHAPGSPPLHHVLVLNSGSSSLKWAVLDAGSEQVLRDGTARWEDAEGGRHAAEIERAFQQVGAVQAVGHRVVHGGMRFRDAVLVTDAVRAGIAALADLAPLHNPTALAGIDAAARLLPGVPQVAAFDTAFHATLPDAAALYPLPWPWVERWGLRRFGFHGLSVQYAVQRATEMLGGRPPRLVVCHLGSGCSATAVRDGRSVDTTMGFTPLDGLMMGRRSGAVDPGLLLYLLRQQGVIPADLDRGLNDEAGLLGVSGVSSDLRHVQAAADAGNPRARLAIEMFVHRLVRAVGALAAVLGGLDALVFTGGIGEHSPRLRAAAAASLGHFGIALDAAANASADADAEIAAASSAVRVLVLTAREDLIVLRETVRVLADGQTR
jgi:acetate kinase